MDESDSPDIATETVARDGSSNSSSNNSKDHQSPAGPPAENASPKKLSRDGMASTPPTNAPSSAAAAVDLTSQATGMLLSAGGGAHATLSGGGEGGTPLVIPQPYLHYIQLQTQLLQQQQNLVNSFELSSKLAAAAAAASTNSDNSESSNGPSGAGVGGNAGKSSTPGPTTPGSLVGADGKGARGGESELGSDDSMDFNDGVYTDEEYEDGKGGKNDGRIRHSGSAG